MGNEQSNDQKANQLIHEQQETIRKQQLLIAKQQAEQAKATPKGAKPKVATSSGQKSAPKAAPKAVPKSAPKSDPKSAPKNPGTFSEYKCPSCNAFWRSKHPPSVRQCNNCHIDVYALTAGGPKADGLAKPKNDAIIRNNLNNANAAKKNVNKELNSNQNMQLIGDFKCPRCDLSWSSAYAGFALQCRKCRADVLPYNLTQKNSRREDSGEGWTLLGQQKGN